MSEKVGELAYIIVDCIDNEHVASFWSNVLGLKITRRSHPYIDLAHSIENGPVISFQKVDEVKTTKNRLHLDVKVTNLEQAAEQIQTLGGALIKKCYEEPYEWYVMVDPEENEFCLVTG